MVFVFGISQEGAHMFLEVLPSLSFGCQEMIIKGHWWQNLKQKPLKEEAQNIGLLTTVELIASFTIKPQELKATEGHGSQWMCCNFIV